MFKKGIVSKQDGKLSVKSKVTFIRCLKIFGKDALSFLNNISTVDLRKLEDGLSQRILFLNKFAKITRDGYVYRLDAENLYLLLFDYKISEFLQYLKSKILVSKVSVEIMEDFVYLLLGEENKKPQITRDIAIQENFVIGRGYFVGVNDIFYVGDIASKMKEECNAIELEWLNSARIANKIPYFTVDFDENILANEVMDWIRVDISKGCFIGQEYVSRILFKGRLRKKLIFFSASYKLFEQFDSFKQFMDLTSGVHCLDTQEVFGFAYLNLDFIEAHPEILGEIVDKN